MGAAVAYNISHLATISSYDYPDDGWAGMDGLLGRDRIRFGLGVLSREGSKGLKQNLEDLYYSTEMVDNPYAYMDASSALESYGGSRLDGMDKRTAEGMLAPAKFDIRKEITFKDSEYCCRVNGDKTVRQLRICLPKEISDDGYGVMSFWEADNMVAKGDYNPYHDKCSHTIRLVDYESAKPEDVKVPDRSVYVKKDGQTKRIKMNMEQAAEYNNKIVEQKFKRMEARKNIGKAMQDGETAISRQISIQKGLGE